MKTGVSLQALAAEIERQRDAKRDYVADTRKMAMSVTGNGLLLGDAESHEAFSLSDNAHGQIADRLKIPRKYYDRMRAENSGLLAENVNTWFTTQPEKRMIRTLDGTARAFLSERYRTLDNAELAEAVLPTLMEEPGIKVESCEVTERRMYIKAVTPRLEADIVEGDTVQAGIVISNSEIGFGSLAIQPLLYRLVCKNGMISNDFSLKKHHIGRKNSSDEAIRELLADETKAADDKAFWLTVRDLVKASLKEALFEKIVGSARKAAGNKMVDSPVEVVERLSKSHGLNESENKGVLQHLIQGGDLSQWGLVNAVTRFSQDVDDYDRATELERMGGQIVELPKSDWRALAEQAA